MILLIFIVAPVSGLQHMLDVCITFSRYIFLLMKRIHCDCHYQDGLCCSQNARTGTATRSSRAGTTTTDARRRSRAVRTYSATATFTVARSRASASTAARRASSRPPSSSRHVTAGASRPRDRRRTRCRHAWGL